MYKYLFILFSIFLTTGKLYSQTRQFTIQLASFSTPENDEFSPVYYQDGIVFCTNQTDNSIISYRNDQNGLFKIFYVTKKDSLEWRRAKILAKEITSSFNDGPATFNEKGNIIYYSRNNFIETSLKNVNNASNKIGIYSAELINGKWENIKPFPYNNTSYSLGTPALAPNEDRIYFSSDMPGGYGGMDLYYSNKHNGEWDKPVNLGPLINTPKNESFPFASKSGKLFFASDGHDGFGGKDLYYTGEINGKWISPVHLDSTINSSANEFGLVTDSLFENGYFSSNRLKTDDIYSFSALPMTFAKCNTFEENNYCFTFYDEQYLPNDTTDVTYLWDFGNGIKRTGREVGHCFPGPGKYKVKLSITDDLTGEMLVDQLEYDIDLEEIEQAYIASPNIGIVGKPLIFNGLKSNLKNYLTKDYFWSFGDDFKRGRFIEQTTFGKKGEYIVQLGIVGNNDSIETFQKMCVMKKIRIYDSYQKLKPLVENAGNTYTIKDSFTNPTETLQMRIYLMDDLSETQKEKIKELTNESQEVVITFNNRGITDASYPFLDKVAEVLKANSDIRLEMYAYSLKNELYDNMMEISEKWAQEISFYFKNKKIVDDTYCCKGLGFSDPVLEPFITDSQIINGVIDFIFINNQ